MLSRVKSIHFEVESSSSTLNLYFSIHRKLWVYFVKEFSSYTFFPSLYPTTKSIHYFYIFLCEECVYVQSIYGIKYILKKSYRNSNNVTLYYRTWDIKLWSYSVRKSIWICSFDSNFKPYWMVELPLYNVYTAKEEIIYSARYAKNLETVFFLNNIFHMKYECLKEISWLVVVMCTYKCTFWISKVSWRFIYEKREWLPE